MDAIKPGKKRSSRYGLRIGMDFDKCEQCSQKGEKPGEISNARVTT
jgi:hypothetical protein